MRQTLTHYRKGFLRIRLQGFSPERFLNLCASNQIEIWDLRHQDGAYQFYITLDGFRRIRPLVRKAHVRLRVLGRFGLPFFLYRSRKRKLYGVGIGGFFLILFVMSHFIWNISLEGNVRFTDDMLLHYLKSQEIAYGTYKHSIDCDALEEAIRSDYPEIIWVSARISGTRLMIRLKENEVMAAIPEKEEEPRDLVADRDGVITRMVVRKGKAQVQPGDTVEKGQVLVSGSIPITDDGGGLVGMQYVRADADISARFPVAYRAPVSSAAAERVYTGKKRSGIQLRIPGYSLTFLLPGKQALPWEFVRESRQVSVMGDFFLPIWVDRITGREYEITDHLRTKEELETEKNRIHALKMENLQEKGVQIIENNVKILKKRSNWEVQGQFVVEDLIGTGQNISRTEETEQPDERNGNNH